MEHQDDALVESVAKLSGQLQRKRQIIRKLAYVLKADCRHFQSIADQLKQENPDIPDAIKYCEALSSALRGIVTIMSILYEDIDEGIDSVFETAEADT